MIRAVLFDFDGTIANTVSALREAVNLTMEKFGYPLHTDEDILRFVNHGARELVRRAMPAKEAADPGLVDIVYADYNKQMESVFLHTRVAYPGVAELIAELHKTYRIGVLSNKQDEFLRRLCEQVLLPGTFDATQGVVPDKPTKPDPYLANRLAERLGVLPEECVMVGDSDVDIQTAANAKMIQIGVTWGFRSAEFLRAHGAIRLAATPGEVVAYLNEIESTEKEKKGC